MGNHKFDSPISTQWNKQPNLNIIIRSSGHLCFSWNENRSFFKRKIKDKLSNHATARNNPPTFICKPNHNGYSQGLAWKLSRCSNVHHPRTLGWAEEALSPEDINLHEQENEPHWIDRKSSAFCFRWHHHQPGHWPCLRRRSEAWANRVIPTSELLPQALLQKQIDLQNDLEDAFGKIRKLIVQIDLVISLQAYIRHPSLLLLQVTQKMIPYFFSPMMLVGL